MLFALPVHSSSVKEGRMNHSRLQPRIDEASRILLGRSKSNNQNNGKYKAVLPLTARTVNAFCRGWLLFIRHRMYNKLRMSDGQTCGLDETSSPSATPSEPQPKVSSKCQWDVVCNQWFQCHCCHCNSQQLHDKVQASVSGSWFTETATGAEPHTRTGNVHWAERSESKLKVIATNPEFLCHTHWCFSAESRPLSLEPLWTADQSPCLQHGFFPNARLVKSNLQQTLSAKQKCFSYWLTWQHQIALPRLIALGLACQPMPQIKIQMSDLLGRQIAYKLLCNRNVESLSFERNACLGPRPKHWDCASTFGPTRYDSTSIDDSAVFLRLFISFDVYPWNLKLHNYYRSNESNTRAEAQI